MIKYFSFHYFNNSVRLLLNLVGLHPTARACSLSYMQQLETVIYVFSDQQELLFILIEHMPLLPM